MNDKRLKMELHKVLREIRTNGRMYSVYRDKLDKYGETISDEREQVATILGLFHVTKGYITEKAQEGTRTHSKGEPKLLVTYADSEPLQNGDCISFNGNDYRVIGKNNINEYNIVVDVSLELVLNGKN